MKRMIAIVLVILTMTAVLAGCNGTGNRTGVTSRSQTPNYYGDTYVPENGTGMTGTYGDGTPSTNENGIIDDNRSTAQDDHPVQEFGNDVQDIIDDAGRAVEDTGRAVEDAVDGRSRTNGTGMAGGR